MRRPLPSVGGPSLGHRQRLRHQRRNPPGAAVCAGPGAAPPRQRPGGSPPGSSAGWRPRWIASMWPRLAFGTRSPPKTEHPPLKKLLEVPPTSSPVWARLPTGCAEFVGPVRRPPTSSGRESLLDCWGCGIGKQAGGAPHQHRLCPAATVMTDRMDVMILPLHGERGRLAPGTLLRRGAGLMRTAHSIARLPGGRIRGSPKGSPFQTLDGEPVEADGYRIEVVPERIRMHLPRNSPLLLHLPPPGEEARRYDPAAAPMRRRELPGAGSSRAGSLADSGRAEGPPPTSPDRIPQKFRTSRGPALLSPIRS